MIPGQKVKNLMQAACKKILKKKCADHECFLNYESTKCKTIYWCAEKSSVPVSTELFLRISDFQKGLKDSS